MSTTPPFEGLTPDTVLNALEQLGLPVDARIYPLNSYENRVYQVGLEGTEPVVVKFYRPGRWSDAQILEEHSFTAALAELDVPVVAPQPIHGATLLHCGNYRLTIFPRRGGHAPEPENLDQLYRLGQILGRVHALGRAEPFAARITLTPTTWGAASREFLMEGGFIPQSLRPAYDSVTEHLLEKVGRAFAGTDYRSLRIHGDCHPGNILCRGEDLLLVDFDDCCQGPAVQDLWMLLAGERHERETQLAALLEGYEEFTEFAPRELRLIEPLRTLRLMHYSAWLARRWDDPAFPHHFPWFNTERYWASHILTLREQMSALDEPPLRVHGY